MTLAAPGALTPIPARRSELPCSWLLCCAVTLKQAALLVEAAQPTLEWGREQCSVKFCYQPPKDVLGAGRRFEARAWLQEIQQLQCALGLAMLCLLQDGA